MVLIDRWVQCHAAMRTTREGTAMEHRTGLVDALCSLGFTTYEARTYTGLLKEYGQTAYGLSKITGVPQPKIYEVLRKLEARGAAVLIDTDPQKYSATPPNDLLASLRVEFESRMDTADHEVAVALSGSEQLTEAPEVMTGLYGKTSVLDTARNLMAKAREKVYLSAWIPEISELAPEIDRASQDGVFFVTVGFGQGHATIPNGQFYRHGSTLKTLYHHHQNRHLALVIDGKSILWATYVDEVGWTGLLAHDRRLVGLVRSYIRHDIYVQKIYARFGPELMDTFGPGLEFLTDVAHDFVMSDVAPESVTSETLRTEDAV